MNTETRDYVTELRAALGDLPRAEVEAIVEDVRPQLAEDAGRLGTPAEYAAELRAAAGLPARVPRQGLLPRIALWVLAITTVAAGYAGYLSEGIASNDARYSLPVFGLALVATWFVVARFGPALTPVAALPEVRLLDVRAPAPVMRYLASLHPAWCLLRALLVGLGVLLLNYTIGWYAGTSEVIALAVAAVVLFAGHRSRTDRRWLWLSVPAGAWAVGVAFRLFGYLPLIVSGDIGYVHL